MTEHRAPIDTPSGSLRVWWIPQVPGPRFLVPVVDLDDARIILRTLARYDLFQLEQRIKGDYANVGGLEVFEDGQWVEWNNEDSDGIGDVMLSMPSETIPALQETTTPAQLARVVMPLSARVTCTRMRMCASPMRSVRPISAHVNEPDGTAWRVLTITVNGIEGWYGDPPYPDCPGNSWIDLEVECPHDHPPTEAKPIDLRGFVLCEAIDLPVSAGNTERDRRWAEDFRKDRGA